MSLSKSLIYLPGICDFNVWHNIPNDNGAINTFTAAVDNWQVRSSNHTADDFCRYVNSKFCRGISEWYAMTEEDYQLFLSTYDDPDDDDEEVFIQEFYDDEY